MTGRRRHHAAAALAPAVAALLAVAGCTGVPTSSGPQTVEKVGIGGQAPVESIRPTHNAPAPQIIREFLAANAADPGKHTSARAFLTRAARNRWSDNTVTIISDEVPGTYDAVNRTVTVFGRMFGTLDKSGRYTPVLEGDGTGGARVSFQFKLASVDGQFRIDQLRPGLLLTDKQFAENYNQQSLYFYDDAQKYLVPDPRYTDIVDRRELAEWLLDQLIAGPRPDLQNAVTGDTVPTQADASRIKVEPGAPTKIEIPGSRQLDPDGRDRLAAVLSQTLDGALSGGDMTITDGGTAVTIPHTGNRFTPSDFTSALGRHSPATDVFYLSAGRVFTQSGVALAGPLGKGTHLLDSVALSRPAAGGPLLAAGVRGTGSDEQLLVGNAKMGVKATTVRGTLSRPAFAPGRNEVWVGKGSGIVRVTIDGTGGHASAVPIVQAPGNGRIVAVRLSPDGSRIAVVLAASGRPGGQLCVGSVVRSADEVRIDSLQTISPQQARITDVAWLNQLRLFAVGRLSVSQDSLTFDTGVDGTDWSSHQLGLSRAADSVTVTTGASAWVSANGFVWMQNAGQWVSPTPGQTVGTNPVYLE
jgi:Lipoprotein LpqB beta-propeller domain